MRRAILLVVLLVISGAGGFWWWALLRPGPSELLDVEITHGETVAAVLESLHASRLMPSTFAGRLYVTVFGRDRSFRYGHYRIPPRSRPIEVLERILEGRVEAVAITVIEGSTARERSLRASRLRASAVSLSGRR